MGLPSRASSFVYAGRTVLANALSSAVAPSSHFSNRCFSYRPQETIIILRAKKAHRRRTGRGWAGEADAVTKIAIQEARRTFEKGTLTSRVGRQQMAIGTASHPLSHVAAIVMNHHLTWDPALSQCHAFLQCTLSLIAFRSG